VEGHQRSRWRLTPGKRGASAAAFSRTRTWR